LSAKTRWNRAENAEIVNTLKLTDGGILSYRDLGRGVPIILIHGWGTSSGFFDRQVDALSTSHRLVIPDLRGHGMSTPFEADMGFGVLAEDIHALMVALDLSAAVVVGWSLGALVAWDLLSRLNGNRLAGVVTVDMVPRLLNDEQWSYGLRNGPDGGVFDRSVEKMRADWRAYTSVFLPRIYARNSQADRTGEIEHGCSVAGNNDPESMALIWRAMVDQDFRQQVAAIQLPALVLYGEQSRLYAAEASEWLSEQISNSRLIGFEQSGHAPNLEEPDRFNQAIEDFANQLNPPLIQSSPEPTGNNLE
jgi:pimeloyl-ACP methyl ester carboxylesterase